jgi:hypothetical protein
MLCLPSVVVVEDHFVRASVFASWFQAVQLSKLHKAVFDERKVSNKLPKNYRFSSPNNGFSCRFKKHLLTHNIKFDEKTHGYREQDKNIFKIVDACALKNGENLADKNLAEIGILPGLPYNTESEMPNTSIAFQVIEPMLTEFTGETSFIV